MVKNALPALPVPRELALSSSKGRGKLVSGVPPDLCVVCPLFAASCSLQNPQSEIVLRTPTLRAGSQFRNPQSPLCPMPNLPAAR
jgi:hypothetical protein